MSFDIAFLGTGSGYPTPNRGASGIALRYEGEVWLVDCGEGTQTQIMKLKLIKPGKITKIFITHLHGDHIFGLPGLLCTISMAYKSCNGDEIVEEIESEATVQSNSVIEIYGPCGLRRFLRETLSLSRSILAFKYVVHELIPEKKQYSDLKVEDPDWDVWSVDHRASGILHYNECNRGRAIFFDQSCKCWPVCKDDNFTVVAGQLCHRIPSFGFVFTEHPRRGKLDHEKLSMAGVPKGPLFGRIKRGESITLENGHIINPSQFIGPERPGRKVAILQDTCDSWSMLNICKNCDFIIHEATNEDAHKKQSVANGHSTPSMAGEFALRASGICLVLTHVSQRYKDVKLHELQPDDLTVDKLVEEARSVFQGPVIVAYDGLLLPVSSNKR